MRSQKESRSVAAGAVRAEARRLGIEPETLSAEEAVRVLDDLYRLDPDLVASSWYEDAVERQIYLFRKEWRDWLLDRSQLSQGLSTEELATQPPASG